MENRHITDEQQVLSSLAREGSDSRRETTAMVSAGLGVLTWPVRIKAHVTHNVYSVRPVVIGDAGAVPVEMGESTEATNLAESFLSEGALAVGTYAIVFRTGRKNVFHAVP